jgi:hypothetical protein
MLFTVYHLTLPPPPPHILHGVIYAVKKASTTYRLPITGFMLGLFFHSEDEGGTFLRNIGGLPSNYVDL